MRFQIILTSFQVRSVIGCLSLSMGLLACNAQGQQNAGAKDADADMAKPPYEVECTEDAESGGRVCFVNEETYIGWRTFHAFCLRCHAQDAVGSVFAPSLVERLRAIDKERFMKVVDEGYTGLTGVMPPWNENPNVKKRYEELYAYLKARADRALPPGRPKRFPKKDSE